MQIEAWVLRTVQQYARRVGISVDDECHCEREHDDDEDLSE